MLQNSNDNEEIDDRGVRALLLAPPLYVCQKSIDLKAEVEEEVGRSFYNLCALSLSDCNAYTEMRSLANERYGLQLLDPYLPDGSLDQRFDLIDILKDFECELRRDIGLETSLNLFLLTASLFVSDWTAFIGRFNYNMIEQMFVERKPERGAKFLATFGVKCISSSIAQHGLGIVKTAIDVAYKLLEQVCIVLFIG